MARDGEEFVCPNRVWLHSNEFHPPMCPFLWWSADCNKVVRRASTQIGMHGVQDYIHMWERMEIRRELEKWDPSNAKSTKEDSGWGSSTRRKKGRPRGSKKKPRSHSLWIGFPPKVHDDLDDDAD
ncbi:hypothetical protein SUGI_0026950 [Cryptomeria japonica]|nr:hypothetical protein SUGI_0026950 [Cryptomeria japonica]